MAHVTPHRESLMEKKPSNLPLRKFPRVRVSEFSRQRVELRPASGTAKPFYKLVCFANYHFCFANYQFCFVSFVSLFRFANYRKPCRCISIGNFSAKQWLQRLLRAFSLAQQRCREMLWSYKRIERHDSATPITAPSTIFLDPSAAAYCWSPRFSNSDRKDRQLNPKRKAAVLIAW